MRIAQWVQMNFNDRVETAMQIGYDRQEAEVLAKKGDNLPRAFIEELDDFEDEHWDPNFAAQTWNAASKANRKVMLAQAGITNCSELEELDYATLPPTAVRMLGAKFSAHRVWANWREEQRLLWLKENGTPEAALALKDFRDLPDHIRKELEGDYAQVGDELSKSYSAAKFFGTGEKIDARDWARLSPEERVELLREKGTYDFKKVAQLGWDQLPENTRKALEHGYAREAGFSAKFDAKQEIENAGYEVGEAGSGANATVWARKKGPPLSGGTVQHAKSWDELKQRLQLSAKFSGLDEEGADEELADLWSSLSDIERKKAMEEAGLPHGPLTPWRSLNRQEKKKLANVLDPGGNYKAKFTADRDWDHAPPTTRLLWLQHGVGGFIGDRDVAAKEWPQLSADEQRKVRKAIKEVKDRYGELPTAKADQAGFTAKFSTQDVKTLWKKASKAQRRQALNKAKLPHKYALAALDAALAVPNLDGDEGDRVCAALQELSGEKLSAKFNSELIADGWNTTGKADRKEILKKAGFSEIEIQSFWDHSWNEFHPILQQRIAAAIGLKMQASIKFDAASHWNEMSLDQKQGDAEALGWDASQAARRKRQR